MRRLLLIVLVLFCVVLIMPAIYLKAEMRSSETEKAPDSVTAYNRSSTQTSSEYASEYLILVNKEHGLGEDYIPDDLVTVDSSIAIGGGMQMDSKAAEALENLIDAAETEGYTIRLVSGYRSYDLQKSIFESNVAKDGRDIAETYSAPPGHSEHQTGLAADVSSPCVAYDLIEQYGEEPEGIWLAENAHKFGFIIRYQEDTQDITGYVYEPWHIRYVGMRPAAEVYQQDVTFEEYISTLSLQ